MKRPPRAAACGITDLGWIHKTSYERELPLSISLVSPLPHLTQCPPHRLCSHGVHPNSQDPCGWVLFTPTCCHSHIQAALLKKSRLLWAHKRRSPCMLEAWWGTELQMCRAVSSSLFESRYKARWPVLVSVRNQRAHKALITGKELGWGGGVLPWQ